MIAGLSLISVFSLKRRERSRKRSVFFQSDLSFAQSWETNWALGCTAEAVCVSLEPLAFTSGTVCEFRPQGSLTESLKRVVARRLEYIYTDICGLGWTRFCHVLSLRYRNPRNSCRLWGAECHRNPRRPLCSTASQEKIRFRFSRIRLQNSAQQEKSSFLSLDKDENSGSLGRIDAVVFQLTHHKLTESC
ncbi:hypothetical protein TGVEG_270040 [Toxoplasma gondii VEG]|uniref:Uncharacterized protein n=3 Tax=Toxoplasma gondii TaxID=5811 RepID=B9Q5T8_TOXGV|nr:hypothetical protein TGVEG_270040 [Toxoplasma gondii VEG]KFG52261.1 hypothetical protein TGP89_270040 [Toxoplasma gondii p89]PUA87834.1 hypothetical protein TGBR9_270040 [Toxoplasma gondii TgCATBr9]CEL75356.1 TPA: hypothetical protein BN1205_017240 [Toxoplasma gondii VEG]